MVVVLKVGEDVKEYDVKVEEYVKVVGLKVEEYVKVEGVKVELYVEVEDMKVVGAGSQAPRSQECPLEAQACNATINCHPRTLII